MFVPPAILTLIRDCGKVRYEATDQDLQNRHPSKASPKAALELDRCNSNSWLHDLRRDLQGYPLQCLRAAKNIFDLSLLGYRLLEGGSWNHPQTYPQYPQETTLVRSQLSIVPSLSNDFGGQRNVAIVHCNQLVRSTIVSGDGHSS